MPRHQPPPPPLPAWDDAPRCLVTKGLLAADMCLSPSAISQYLNQGMPEGPGGMLDYTAALDWMLGNLDATKARRTRAEASSMRRFLNSQADTYATVRAGIEAGAAAAYAAALAAGLPEEAAAHLADDAAARAVPLMNRCLVDDANEPLPAPPHGIWRRAMAGAGWGDVAQAGNPAFANVRAADNSPATLSDLNIPRQRAADMKA